MNKRNKIIYWVATLWLSLGMTSTAIVQLSHKQSEVDFIHELGYPTYLLTIIGIWKIAGVVIVLKPKFTLVKEWAYAGFFFCMSGAIFSHIAVSHTFTEMAPAMLLLVLTIISWYMRPVDRKFTSLQTA